MFYQPTYSAFRPDVICGLLRPGAVLEPSQRSTSESWGRSQWGCSPSMREAGLRLQCHHKPAADTRLWFQHSGGGTYRHPDCIESLRPVWDTWGPVSRKEKKKKWFDLYKVNRCEPRFLMEVASKLLILSCCSFSQPAWRSYYHSE